MSRPPPVPIGSFTDHLQPFGPGVSSVFRPEQGQDRIPYNDEVAFQVTKEPDAGLPVRGGLPCSERLDLESVGDRHRLVKENLHDPFVDPNLLLVRSFQLPDSGIPVPVFIVIFPFGNPKAISEQEGVFHPSVSFPE